MLPPGAPGQAAVVGRMAVAEQARGQGVGAGLLRDAFTRFWERRERNVGLGVDAASDSGAFRLYERAGMTPSIGWVLYEKALAD